MNGFIPTTIKRPQNGEQNSSACGAFDFVSPCSRETQSKFKTQGVAIVIQTTKIRELDKMHHLNNHTLTLQRWPSKMNAQS